MTANNMIERATGHAGNGGGRSVSPWRIAAWILAVLALLLPLVAMPFTDEVSWTLGDFVFAGTLLFGALGAYEIATRITTSSTYRAGVGVAIAGAVLLTWINAAVGLTDSGADAAFLGVPAVGFVGALIARFRPRGMARALLATALAQAGIGGTALIAGGIPPYNSAAEVLGLTGFFVALFVGSAWLFWRSAQGASGQRLHTASFPTAPRRAHGILSALLLLIGVALMAYMIVVEGEPGALPLLLITLGLGWYFAPQFRRWYHST